MKHIILTGGGTAGHVTPNMALVPKLIDEGYNIYYIGSYEGMEKKLIEDIGITYYGISSGNFADILISKTSLIHSELSKDFLKQKDLKETSSRRCIFQRWLCHCACCNRCQTASIFP